MAFVDVPQVALPIRSTHTVVFSRDVALKCRKAVIWSVMLKHNVMCVRTTRLKSAC